jgi:hypothetical protein
MARSSKLQVMISSRCKDLFPNTAEGCSLSDIRKDLKKEIESIELFGKTVFEVWISDETPSKPGDQDSWDTCLQAVKNCDIFIALYNGNAGWAQNGGDIGICHAELSTALSLAPGKVRLIELEGVTSTFDTPDGIPNSRFQDYVKKQNLFRGKKVKNVDELKECVNEVLYDALITLAQTGVRDASKGKYHSGEALDWSRLDFKRRAEEMRRILSDVIRKNSGSSSTKEGHLFANIGGTDVLVVPHAIPSTISAGQAKEMVGQPFLNDHQFDTLLMEERGGPLHLIACHKNATETQATKMLGFQDATVVNAPFGVFVADNIQKVQFVFIVNCRDESTTRHGTQRFFEWLGQTGEDVFLAKRALARARIVHAIASELEE